MTEIFYFRTARDIQTNNILSYATAYCCQHKNGKWSIRYVLGCDTKSSLFIRSTSKSPMDVFKEHNLLDNIEVSIFEDGKRKIIKSLN